MILSCSIKLVYCRHCLPGSEHYLELVVLCLVLCVLQRLSSRGGKQSSVLPLFSPCAAPLLLVTLFLGYTRLGLAVF